MHRWRTNITTLTYNNKTFDTQTDYYYAQYLDSLKIEWYYKEMIVPYTDMLYGTKLIHTIPFTIINNDKTEWVETIPDTDIIPDDKTIYILRYIKNQDITYRGLNSNELLFINNKISNR